MKTALSFSPMLLIISAMPKSPIKRETTRVLPKDLASQTLIFETRLQDQANGGDQGPKSTQIKPFSSDVPESLQLP